MLIDYYAALSPDGRDQFPVFFNKLARAIIDTPHTLVDLARTSASTVIMAGDDDLVTVEYQEATRAAVQDGQLTIVPGTSHELPLQKTDLRGPTNLRLADLQTPKFMPG